MGRLNVLLLAALIALSLALVTSQHRARKLYVELQKELELAKNLEIEHGRLQLEQSTWAAHARVERVAAERLGMRAPAPERVRLVPAAAPEAAR
jgi:cell division protein FtsL